MQTISSIADSPDDLIASLLEKIREREKAEPYGYEYDCLNAEIDMVWTALEDKGYTTKQLNRLCWDEGVA